MDTDEIAAFIKELEKTYPEGMIRRFGDRGHIEGIEVIPTGCIALDNALGVGGIPKGRIVEVFGPESGGKTTLMYHVIANAQKQGGLCAFIDTENSMDPQYAKNIGVNVDDLIIAQPEYGEQALSLVDDLLTKGDFALIVLDSIAALTPLAELEGDPGQANMGLQARMMSQAMRRLTNPLNKGNTTLLLTNQTRMKIGVVYGNPETTPGGKAVGFYASVRMRVSGHKKLEDKSGAPYGTETKVSIIKNKVASPYNVAEFVIIYGEGISRGHDLLKMGGKLELVKTRGAYYYYGEQKLGQGTQNCIDFLRDNPEIADEIETQVRELCGLPQC